MLIINRNQLNNLVVTVSQNKTLANPYYLFSFQHILSKEKVQFFPKNISTSATRYDEFQFYEGVRPDYDTTDIPYEIFPYPGQYYYSVYECFSSGSTNPAYAFDKVEEGRALIEDSSVPSPYDYTYISSNEGNDNFIYYEEGVNEARQLISFAYNIFNSRKTTWGWSEVFPSIYYKDLSTGIILEYPNQLYDPASCTNVYDRASGQTFNIEITTGATWPGFTLYMDYDQVKSMGYDWYGYTVAGNEFSALTFNNFTEGFIPGFWSYDVMQHNVDGSTETTTGLWAKDLGTPTNVQIATISGNTAPCIQPSPTPTPTQTPTPTITPTATNTPTPTITPTATITPSPTNTPTPTITPSPTPVYNGITTFGVEVDSAFILGGYSIDYRWTDPSLATGTGTTSSSTTAFSRVWVYDTITFPTPPTTPGDLYTMEIISMPLEYTEAQTWVNINGPVDKITIEIVSYDGISSGLMDVTYYYEGSIIDTDLGKSYNYPLTGSAYEWSALANWDKAAYGYFAVEKANHILTESNVGILTEDNDFIDKE